MADYTGLLDIFNGGGAGASGQRFEGGFLSGLLNDLGIKPLGYRDRMEAMQSTRPQLRPQAPAQPMQYSGRGGAGMPSQPMQGSGMTPANAYAPQPNMTAGQPISAPQMPPQRQPMQGSGMTPANAYQPMSGQQLRSMMMQAYPNMSEEQLATELMQYLKRSGSM
jgi:hypothetical protein